MAMQVYTKITSKVNFLHRKKQVLLKDLRRLFSLAWSESRLKGNVICTYSATLQLHVYMQPGIQI